MARKKTVAAKPTYAARRSAANVKVGLAVANFETAIQQLDDAAAEHATIRDEIDEEITLLENEHARAHTNYEDATRIADRLRTLIS